MIHPEKWHLFVCPKCHGTLQKEASHFLCHRCGELFPLNFDIPHFYKTQELWEVGGNDRPDVNSMRDWKSFLHEVFPDDERRAWISDISRTMTLVLSGIKEGMRVLDIGAGWGTYSIAAAKLEAHVWALDANTEGLIFLAKRCQQEGFHQIVVAQGSALSLPFPDDSFDLVMFNGVFELLPEYIKNDSPEEIQCRALQEARRVLRSNGHLSIAIENRYGLVYLAGARDEHTGLRFITVLPRSIASFYSQLLRRKPFRIYTHSLRGLKKLLNKTGFVLGRGYGVYPNYRYPDYFYYLRLPLAVKHLVAALRGLRGETLIGRLQSRLFCLFSEFPSFPEYLLRKFPLSLVALASKSPKKTSLPSSIDVHRTRFGWLERRSGSKGSFIYRYILDDRLFEVFKREGKALSRFAESDRQKLVPKIIREEIHSGCRIRVLEDVGNINLLEQLQQTRWSPELQRQSFDAFLRWLKDAQKVSVDGFPHKYEVMHEVRQIIKREPRLSNIVTDQAISNSPAILSNADFNPSNMVFAKGKLMVLDWECPCREHSVMVLGHFFLQMTVFADRFPTVFKVHKRRPERCIGDMFSQAITALSSVEKKWLISKSDVFLWIATDFSAQFNTAKPPIPDKQEIMKRLSGIAR